MAKLVCCFTSRFVPSVYSGSLGHIRPFSATCLILRWQHLSERIGVYEIDASHSPHVTAPDRLAALLQTIISEWA